jgi:hypothetical protein
VGLGDVTGVFSRYFVVGFFLPSFFGLALLKTTLSDRWLPKAVEADTSHAFLVLGGLALLIGLVLLGLRDPLIYSISGYPLIRETPSRLYRPVGAFGSRLHGRQLAEFDALELRTKEKAGETPEEFSRRRRAQWQFGLRFPANRQKVLPTRLGNAIRAWEDYARSRWSLETVVVWPRINALLSEQESKLHADAETDFFFFFNSGLIAALVGITMTSNGIADQPHSLWLAWIYVVPFGLAYLFYRVSVGAAQRWGRHVSGAIDLHRFELYERIGVSRPASGQEAVDIGKAINRMLLYGEGIPDGMLATPEPVSERTKEQ